MPRRSQRLLPRAGSRELFGRSHRLHHALGACSKSTHHGHWVGMQDLGFYKVVYVVSCQTSLRVGLPTPSTTIFLVRGMKYHDISVKMS